MTGILAKLGSRTAFIGATIVNEGQVFGGNGGMFGGPGVVFNQYSPTTLINSGLIQGGYGYGASGISANASDGPGNVPTVFSYVLNTGTIRGGRYNGDGASLSFTTLVNFGTIASGSPRGVDEQTGLALSGGLAVNHGLIQGGANAGEEAGIGDGVFIGEFISASRVDVSDSTLVNYGTITGGTGVALYGVTTLINAGTIDGTYVGVNLTSGSTVVDSGLIEGSNFAVIIYNPYLSVDGPARLVLDAGARLTGEIFGEHGLGLVNLYNVLELAPGSLANSGSLGGLGASVTGFGTIQFDPGAAWTLGGTTAGLTQGETITGFAPGDTLDLTGFSTTSHTYVTGTGLELTGPDGTATLDLTGSFSSADFTVTGDGAGGSLIALDHAACFTAGTRIATARGKVLVEKLQAGDVVKTMRGGFSPIKWIGISRYAGRFCSGKPHILPVRIRRHALGFNIPSRDLLVSPDHAICEGGMLIHAWLLINGVSITQLERVEQLDYYHIELDRHDVIFAENCPAESYLDTGCRNRFHNAADFLQAFPAPLTPQPPCLPRLEHGLHLALIQRRLAARAGIPAAKPKIGRLRGNLDEAGPHVLRGWAQDEATPAMPQWVDILVNEQLAGRVLANFYRPDLRQAGIGNGCHGFVWKLPAGLTGRLAVRRSLDGATLAA